MANLADVASQEVRDHAAQPPAVQIRPEGIGRARPASRLPDVPHQRPFFAHGEGIAGSWDEGSKGREANTERGGARGVQAAATRPGHRRGSRLTVRMSFLQARSVERKAELRYLFAVDRGSHETCASRRH